MKKKTCATNLLWREFCRRFQNRFVPTRVLFWLSFNCLSMENFFVDRLGKEENKTSIQNDDRQTDCFDECEDLELFDELPSNAKEIKSKTHSDINLGNTYLISSYKCLNKNEEKSYVDKLLEKSVINKGLEKEFFIPSEKSKKIPKSERKKLRERTKGKNWFDMPATEVTEELKTDFELLKMRSVLDGKHKYKKNDITHIPKYFQVGQVVESPADFYGGRLPKSLRKKTMVEELLADAEFKKYQKKKFKEIMDENRRKKRSIKNSEKNKIQKKGKSKR